MDTEPVKSCFLTSLEARSLDDSRWELIADLVYDSAIFGGRITASA